MGTWEQINGGTLPHVTVCSFQNAVHVHTQDKDADPSAAVRWSGRRRCPISFYTQLSSFLEIFHYQLPGSTVSVDISTVPVARHFPRGTRPRLLLSFLTPNFEMEEVKPALTSPVVEEAMDSSMPGTPDVKHSNEGVVLVPRPSDDPRDPLVS